MNDSRDAHKSSQIRPAISFMDANSHRAIALADVARARHLSTSRLAHVFKEQMGITVIEYLTRVRIGHAKRLLLSTELSCTEICLQVGYRNQSYFTRMFKRVVGMTPSEFRRTNPR